MRLIDADALLETMENFFIKAEDEARYAGRRDAEATWNDAVYMIKTAPTIEERKTGKWKYGVCSECEFSWADITLLHEVPYFCPNCGADMRGKTDEKT